MCYPRSIMDSLFRRPRVDFTFKPVLLAVIDYASWGLEVKLLVYFSVNNVGLLISPISEEV